ncbi:hypothetical protein [Lysobacter enzymogenes]|uniref:hypothetical protein n=1 Tax=Lysobacter enzymogenes TaxID=69 RepID=UPI002264383E|nr:hypothetical protein [Lysobacter enzymogenes]UZW62468.1 hypothetical protein BV903_009315 [Lysobacter enzymogenes]
MVVSRIVVRSFDRRASRGAAASLRVRRDRGKRARGVAARAVASADRRRIDAAASDGLARSSR